MSYKVGIIFILAAIALHFGNKIYTNWDNHRVKQEVTINKDTNHYIDRSAETDYIKAMYRIDGSIDSTILKEFKRIKKLHDEQETKYNSPFILTTTYNHHSVTDYGDARFIDSIKCIRFNEMTMNMPVYDKLEVEEEQAKKALEIAEENAKKAEERLLEKLNKPCN